MISPTLYARVVEKVPEAEVTGLLRSVEWAGIPTKEYWRYACPNMGDPPLHDETAAALILRHWLGMLPDDATLGREVTQEDDSGQYTWAVWEPNGWPGHVAYGPTPEEALAEWLMSRSGE